MDSQNDPNAPVDGESRESKKSNLYRTARSEVFNELLYNGTKESYFFNILIQGQLNKNFNKRQCF